MVLLPVHAMHESANDGKADIEGSSLGVSFYPKQKLADGCAVAREGAPSPRGASLASGTIRRSGFLRPNAGSPASD